MTARVNDMLFRFSFSHADRETTCNLELCDPHTGEWLMEGFGRTICHIKDPYIREVGNKEALARAMASSSYFNEGYGFVLPEPAKARRRELWNSYHSRSPRTLNRIKGER